MHKNAVNHGRFILIRALDIFGTLAFAISGAFRAVKYELDLLGVMVLAVATGIGGGILRDVMLGAISPNALRDETYLVVCVIGGFLVFVAAPKIAVRWDGVMAADAIGLGVFAAIGAASAEAHGAGFVTIMIMAVLTACGGGVVRDVLVREIPAILKSDFYATAALIGGAYYAALNVAGLSVETRLACTIAITWLIRVFTMRYRLALPRVKSLPASPSQLTQLRKSGSKEKQKEESPKKSAGGNS